MKKDKKIRKATEATEATEAKVLIVDKRQQLPKKRIADKKGSSAIIAPPRLRGRPRKARKVRKLKVLIVAKRQQLPREEIVTPPRGRPRGRQPKEDKSRCVCGRNLDYPAKVTEKAIICRCGRRHNKWEGYHLRRTL